MKPRRLTPWARQMFESLERQVNDEAARQRATVKVIFDIDISAQPARETAQWEQHSELRTGICSILAAFSKRES